MSSRRGEQAKGGKVTSESQKSVLRSHEILKCFTAFSLASSSLKLPLPTRHSKCVSHFWQFCRLIAKYTLLGVSNLSVCACTTKCTLAAAE